ncbi:MAG: hypothetical protein ACREPX_03940 [Rhodanobacteraceae bacterium]
MNALAFQPALSPEPASREAELAREFIEGLNNDHANLLAVLAKNPKILDCLAELISWSTEQLHTATAKHVLRLSAELDDHVHRAAIAYARGDA